MESKHGKKKRLKLVLAILLLIILVGGCEKESDQAELLVGKWQLFRICGTTFGSICVQSENKRIEEYTCEWESISYDFEMNETGRRKYKVNDNKIFIYGTDEDGDQIKFKFKFWIRVDTLRLRYDGEFEYYDEFFVRFGDSY